MQAYASSSHGSRFSLDSLSMLVVAGLHVMILHHTPRVINLAAEKYLKEILSQNNQFAMSIRDIYHRTFR